MKLAKVLIYLGILGALAAYVYVVEIKQAHEQEVADKKAEKLFPVKEKEIQEILLSQTGGKEVELKKVSDIWVITKPVKTKADTRALETLLTTIGEASREKLILEKDVKWKDYGLDQPKFSITVRSAKKKDALFFGSQNPNKESYYVRVNKDPRLLLVADTLKNALDKSLLELRDKTVVAIAPENVRRLVVTRADKTLEFTRGKYDTWMMDKPERFRVKGAVMDRNLRALTGLSAREIIDSPEKDGDPYGLEKPQQVITLAGDKPDQVLVIGKPKISKKEDKSATGVYARVKGRHPVFLIDSRVLEGLKTDPKDLRDRRLFGFNPPDIEKFVIDLDGKTWEATRAEDKKKWLVTKPEKNDEVKNWNVTGLLWTFKGLEWKSMESASAKEQALQYLEKPKLLAKLFLKGVKKPIVFSAGWEAPPEHTESAADKKTSQETEKTDEKSQEGENNKEPATKDDQPKAEGKQGAETDTRAKDAKPTLPDTVYATVEPYYEKDAVFTMDPKFLDNVRSGLKQILETK